MKGLSDDVYDHTPTAAIGATAILTFAFTRGRAIAYRNEVRDVDAE